MRVAMPGTKSRAGSCRLACVCMRLSTGDTADLCSFYGGCCGPPLFEPHQSARHRFNRAHRIVSMIGLWEVATRRKEGKWTTDMH